MNDGVFQLTVAQVMAELRRENGLTQEEVARRSGINVKSISSWETGKKTHELKIAKLRRLLAVYGVSLSSFFESVELAIRPDRARAKTIASETPAPQVQMRADSFGERPDRYPSQRSSLGWDF